MNRGNAIVEVLVLGMVLALVLLQLIVGYARISIAGDGATSAAQTAAIWAARSGSATEAAALAEELAPGAIVEAWRDGSVLHVVVRRSVPVIGPAGGQLHYTVVGRGSASISPYRSNG